MLPLLESEGSRDRMRDLDAVRAGMPGASSGPGTAVAFLSRKAAHSSTFVRLGGGHPCPDNP